MYHTLSTSYEEHFLSVAGLPDQAEYGVKKCHCSSANGSKGSRALMNQVFAAVAQNPRGGIISLALTKLPHLRSTASLTPQSFPRGLSTPDSFCIHSEPTRTVEGLMMIVSRLHHNAWMFSFSTNWRQTPTSSSRLDKLPRQM